MIVRTRLFNTPLLEHRHSFFPIILLFSILVCSPCRATPKSSYTLFHRFGPSLTGSHSSKNITNYPWQKRASLEISVTEFNLENKPHFEDLHFFVSSFIKNHEPLEMPSSIPLESIDYQISLLPQDSTELLGESGQPNTDLAISSHPLCAFLFDRSNSKKAVLNEYLNIWIRPATDSVSSAESQPTSINQLQLNLLGIQWAYSSSVSSPSFPASRSMTCGHYVDRASSAISKQSDQHNSIFKSELTTFINNHWKSTFKVSVRKPEKLIDPILRPYLIQKNAEYLPDGRVKEPGPEKGFLAKYWIYILPVVVLLVMGGGPAPEENSSADQPQQSETSN